MTPEHEFKLVRSVVYTCRLLGEHPSSSKVIGALRAISGRGIRKADVCAHMKRLFLDEHLSGNLLGTGTEPEGLFAEPILSTAGTGREKSGTTPEHHARIRNKKQETRYSPESANALSAPSPVAARVRPTVEPVEFPDEDERRVKQCLRFVAEQNASGTVSTGRVLALRAEMHAELARLGAERWRYGMDDANMRGKPWAYARAVMRKATDIPAPAATGPQRWTNGRRPGYSDHPASAETVALLVANSTRFNTDAV